MLLEKRCQRPRVQPALLRDQVKRVPCNQLPSCLIDVSKERGPFTATAMAPAAVR